MRERQAPARRLRASLGPRALEGALVARTERERHPAFDDNASVHARDAAKLTDAAAQPLHRRFDVDHVPRMHGTAVPHALDAPEVRQLLLVLRLREDQD